MRKYEGDHQDPRNQACHKVRHPPHRRQHSDRRHHRRPPARCRHVHHRWAFQFVGTRSRARSRRSSRTAAPRHRLILVAQEVRRVDPARRRQQDLRVRSAVRLRRRIAEQGGARSSRSEPRRDAERERLLRDDERGNEARHRSPRPRRLRRRRGPSPARARRRRRPWLRWRQARHRRGSRPDSSSRSRSASRPRRARAPRPARGSACRG